MAEKKIDFSGRSSINLYGGGFGVVHMMGAVNFVLPRSKVVLMEGVSAGALLSSILISYDFNIEKVIEVWLEIDKRGAGDVFRTSALGIRNWFGSGFYKHDGVRDIIKRYINVEKIMAWEGEVIVVAENMTRGGRNVPFSNKDERVIKNPSLMVEGVLASTCLSPLFPPLAVEGEWYRDGLTCSLAASVERDIDNIFIMLSHNLDEGAGEHHENEHIIRQFISQMRAAVRKDIIKDIKYLKSMGYQLIEQNPTDIFDGVPVSKLKRVVNKIKDTVEAMNPLNPEPINERAITQDKAVLFTPTNSVKSLRTDEFKKGDMKIAIDRSMKEIEEFSQRLEREL